MPGKAARPRVRKQPQRTCVACGEVAGKRTLLRLVRTPDQAVEVDPTGKRSGRGAYVHLSPECAERAIARGALSRALRTPVGEEIARQLTERAAAEAAQNN